MEGNIAATYTLIYRFLKQQSQHKAAEAVKKAAKAIVVLRDDVEQEGPPLEDIIREWKAKENKNTKSGNAASSSEDSDSSDDSSSDSEDSSSSDSSSEDTSGSESEGDDTSDGDESSDDSNDADEVATTKKSPQKVAGSDTSATLSSAGESAREGAKQAVQISKKSAKDTNKAVKDKNRGPESDNSDPDSSDSDSSSKTSASGSSDVGSSSSGSGSSSSSDSSEEDEANANEKVPPNKMQIIEDKGPSTSESSSESEDESDSGPRQKVDTRVAKKRKTLENGAAVTTAVATGSQQISRISQGKEKQPPKVKERFQRVKVQGLGSELLLNNGYEARGGATNDYGERAHRDLITTRGAGFRKEKNKKKRGSYRGGEITMESHSIKFDF